MCVCGGVGGCVCDRCLLGATVAAGLHSLSQDSLVAVPCLPGAEICFSVTETLFLVFFKCSDFPKAPDCWWVWRASDKSLGE